MVSEAERSRKLQMIRHLRGQPPTRDEAGVDKELAAIRRSRKTGWAQPKD